MSEPVSLIDLFARLAAEVPPQMAQPELQAAGQSLERALRAALKDQTLLGLPNLGTRVQPYYGLNLDAQLATLTGGAETLPFPICDRDEGAPRTVLNERGHIVRVWMARRQPRVGVHKPWFEVVSGGGFPVLKPEHLTNLTRLLPAALLVHLRLAAQMRQSFVSALAKASQLIEVLKDGQ